MTEGALSGLKVLDLSHHIAGPYSTRLLAGLGASVIKLERPVVGDVLRRVGPFYQDRPEREHSCPFLYLNTDKKGITLNLKTETGRSMFEELVRWADVLVESFRPGVMDRLGFGYVTVEKLNPAIVMISVSNFGQTGPYRDYALTDLTAQALGGVMNEMGEPDQFPLKLGGNQALYSAGVAAFTGAMTALMAKNIHGVGQLVDVSILEMMAYTEWHASCYYSYSEQERKRQGRYNQWKILRTRDGHMGVVGRWEDIQGFLADSVPDDERLRTPEGRVEHTIEMGELLERALIEGDKIDWYHRGQASGVPWGFVAEMGDVIESPHYAERHFFKELRHPVVGSASYAGLPFTIGSTQSGPWSPAPRLGEHNLDIYSELFSYSREEVVRLYELGVI